MWNGMWHVVGTMCPKTPPPPAGNRAVAQALVGAVRSIALLARSLEGGGPVQTPQQHLPQQQAVPHLALLRHNDLVHLAEQLLLLPPCYSPELQPLLDEPLSFLLDALALRRAAQGVFREQVWGGKAYSIDA